MKKFIITLALSVICACFASAQQIETTPTKPNARYQGNVAVWVSYIGVGGNTSHGIRWQQDYLGLGLETGLWTIVFYSIDWAGVYLDYQHFFNLNDKVSLFLQASPGLAATTFTNIGQSTENEDPNKRPINAIRGCGKLGIGIDWQFEKWGLSLSFQNNLFTQNPQDFSAIYWIPSAQIAFHL